MRAIPFVCYSAEPVAVGKYLSDGVRTAARALGAARYITMQPFDAAAFLCEIEWLIPEAKVGSYYSGSNDHNGNGSVAKADLTV